MRVFSEIDMEEQPDVIAGQLSRINEQLVIKNRRARKIWKAIAIVVGLGFAVYILLVVLAGLLFCVPQYSYSVTGEVSESIVEGTEEE